MARGISTLVEKATEQAQQVAHDAAEALPTALPIETVRVTAKKARKQAEKTAKHAAKKAGKQAAKQVARQQRKHGRRSRRGAASGGVARRGLIVMVAVGAIAGVVMIVRRRAQCQRTADLSGAPDAFGAAVEAERHAFGNGAQRPVATPGA